MNEKYIVTIFLVGYGILAIAKPDWLAVFHKWSNKRILGATFVPSKRTLRIYQLMGVIFIVVAGLIWLGWLK